MSVNQEFGIFVGVDWASQKHDYCILADDGSSSFGEVQHQLKDLDDWIRELVKMAGSRKVAIAIEQKRGSLFNALVQRENVVLFPIDPGKAASYRKSFSKEAKTDQNDALYLARMLKERIDRLDRFIEISPLSNEIHETARLRRLSVDELTRVKLKLQASLKACFPLVLELFGTVDSDATRQILKRWPTQRLLKRAHAKSIRCALSDAGIKDQQRQDQLIDTIRNSPLFCQDSSFSESHDLHVKQLVGQYALIKKVIREYDQRLVELVGKHPDGKLFLSIRGAGPVAAARLISAFESEAPQCPTADHLSARAGIAPVPNSSGKNSGKRHVARYACNKYLKQTFHEFVDRARLWCPWTKARYQQLRAGKMKHAAAIRKLARSWIRILFRMWHTKEKFDGLAYLQKLLVKNPDLKNYLAS